MQGIVGSAKASIDSVETACEQVGSSRRLQGLLRAVLAVGNALNTGTARASAEGVKLDSLMKMADVKVILAGFCWLLVWELLCVWLCYVCMHQVEGVWQRSSTELKITTPHEFCNTVAYSTVLTRPAFMKVPVVGNRCYQHF